MTNGLKSLINLISKPLSLNKTWRHAVAFTQKIMKALKRIFLVLCVAMLGACEPPTECQSFWCSGEEPAEIIKIEPHHATRSIMHVRLKSGETCVKSMHHSNHLVCNGVYYNIGRLMKAGNDRFLNIKCNQH